MEQNTLELDVDSEREALVRTVEPRRPRIALDEETLRRLEPFAVEDRDRYATLAEICPVPLPDSFDLPQHVALRRGALEDLPALLDEVLTGTIVWVADPDTWSAVRDGLPKALRKIPEERFLRLERRPHCDEQTVERLRALVDELDGGREDDDPERVGGIVAVGSGTVNDIAKLAATRCDLPYVSVGTAASMSGYVSGVATVLKDGLETTVPARPPRAVVLDIDVLLEAPRELAAAGLADLASKPLSMADWWLGTRLEDGELDQLPGEIVDHAVDEATRRAEGIRAGDAEAFVALARALVLSGVSMVVAGDCAPASGGEHFLSHLWDMRRLARGEEPGVHGAQVGVATCICAAVYQQVLEVEKPTFKKPRRWIQEVPKVREAHGELAEAVIPPARRKHAGAAERTITLKERWRHLRKGVIALGMPTPEQIRELLEAAGAPTRLAEIGISREEAIHALANARHIRSRYTILDLAHDLGVLPRDAEAILDRAGV